MNRTVTNHLIVWGLSAALVCVVGMALPVGGQSVAYAAEWSSDSPGMTSTDANSEKSGKESTMSGPTESGSMATMPMDVIRASKLHDMKIMGLQNEELGKVHDVVLTPDLTTVSYVALQRGGVLGVGEKLYAIPWSAVSMSADGKSLSVAISKKDIESSQGFDSKKWPDKGDAQWSKTPGETGSMMSMNPDDEMFRMRRLSETLKTDVRDRGDTELGKLSDLGIDQVPGRVVYGIVAWGSLGKKENYAAVPWDMFVLQPKPRLAMIDADRNMLQSVAFEMSNWKSLSDRSYADKLYQQFGEEPYWQVYGFPKVDEQLTSTESWLPGSDYNKMFNASTIETIQGKVDSTGSFRPMSHAVSGLRLKVTTSDGKTLTVHCGPREYISQQGFTFKKGESVSITGSQVQMGKHTVLMATSIETGGKTLNLRDSQGKPMWTENDLKKEMMMKGEKKTENETPSTGNRGMGY